MKKDQVEFEEFILRSYLPDINTASNSPRLAEIIRCFNLLRDGRTSKAGGSEERKSQTFK